MTDILSDKVPHVVHTHHTLPARGGWALARNILQLNVGCGFKKHVFQQLRGNSSYLLYIFFNNLYH